MAGEFEWSGYKAAAADLMDAANLNSLADDCSAATGETSDTITEIDNTTNLYQFMDVEISLASLNVTAEDAAVHLYLFASLDGFNYPSHTVDHSTAANNLIPASARAGSADFNVANAAQRQVIRGVVVPPGKFKAVVTSKLGVSWAASGNTVKFRMYNEAYT